MGFRRFIFRGVTKVRGEWDLVCATFIGAESKRRGCPRLPARQSRVTLLIWNDLSNVLVTFPFLSLWSGAGGGRGGRIDG